MADLIPRNQEVQKIGFGKGKHKVKILSVGSADSEFDLYSNNVQTTSSSDVTAIQLPVPTNSLCNVVVSAVGFATDSTRSYAVESAALFTRTAGNVAQVGSTQALYTAITSGTVVGLTIAANTTDQTVDISVGGAAATTVNWTVVARWQRRSIV